MEVDDAARQKRRWAGLALAALVIAAAWMLWPGAASSPEAQAQGNLNSFPPAGGGIIALSPPDRSGGMPLMAALNARRSDRVFSPVPLTEQQVSDILWAAVGVNRPEGSYRTTPNSHNQQDTEVYIVNENGGFYYDALNHRLESVTDEDLTSVLGAPTALIYVSPVGNENAKLNIGACAMSVYLYAASAGLNTVTKTTFERDVLNSTLKINQPGYIFLIQHIGNKP